MVVGGDDAFGFGLFPGQYGMVVYSKYPIDTDAVRTFQLFQWQDMPGNLMPTGFYSPEEQAILRLSSKSHWDVPVQVGKNKTVHFLVSHPTPPTFDGPEDRNGRRNHDEIRFWADYVGSPKDAAYIYDDNGISGGLKPGSDFVIAGDQNADPLDGDSYDGAINQLLEHPRVNAKDAPASAGAVEASLLQGGVNLEHAGDPKFDTADFAEPPGNIRVDYVLPSKSLRILDSAVFWPVSSDPLSTLTGTWPFPSSDHRLVWVDVHLPHQEQPQRTKVPSTSTLLCRTAPWATGCGWCPRAPNPTSPSTCSVSSLRIFCSGLARAGLRRSPPYPTWSFVLRESGVGSTRL